MSTSTPRCIAAVLALGLSLSACSSLSPSKMMRQNDNTLSDYGAAIRWNEFDAAQGFMDPAALAEHPLTDLERERFKQIQVTGYDVKHKDIEPDGSVDQSVEIRLISRNTQVERTVVDQQHWRWDSASRRFLLTTGLPDFSNNSSSQD